MSDDSNKTDAKSPGRRRMLLGGTALSVLGTVGLGASP